jgi:fatty-acyl-CoA synthase|tara:strand:+ start:4422 stop:4583 length:162 start_codon:yes stop_codon:yes gene_type:complete
MYSQAGHCANALLTRFEPGEHIALRAPNLPEWVIVQLAVGMAGMVLVLLNPAY